MENPGASGTPRGNLRARGDLDLAEDEDEKEKEMGKETLFGF
jgi:hypothetical protein